MPGALPFIGIALGVGGSVLSYSAQQSAASTQATFSALNAASGVQQAQQQSSVAALQNELQATQARTQSQAAFNTAESERATAEQNARIEQEQTRRGRDEFLRQLAAANAQSGGSGAVLATGSPLDMLMAAADQEQQAEQDSQYQINAGRVAGFRRAAATELGGRVSGMNSSLYEIEALSSIQQGRTAEAQARLGGFAGAATAQGMRNSALGGLIGGVAGNLNSFSNSSLNPWRPKKY